MPGLLQTEPTPAPSTPAVPSAPTSTPTKPSTDDPMLAKIREGVEAKLPAQLKADAQKIIVAGLKILYTPKTHAIVQQIYDKAAAAQFQPTAIATGMVNLLGMIYKASGGKMPLPAAYPAGIVLLTYVLGDLEHRGAKVDEPMVKEIGKQMAQLWVKALKSGGASPGAPPPASPPPTQPAPAGV